MMLKKNNTQERHKNIFVTFARKYISTENKAWFLNDWLASKHSSTCFSPSLPKTVLLLVFLTSGRQKRYCFWLRSNTQINLIVCKISELMAASQYPQTTRSLLKTRLLLFIILILFFFSVDKNHRFHGRWINPLPQLLASHYLKMNPDVN